MDSTTNGAPYLPLEVFQTIIHYLPKLTLKNVRLCNKALKAISEPLLFRSITLVPNLNFLVEFHATFCQSPVRQLVHRIDYDDRWLPTIENYNADIRKIPYNDGVIELKQKRVMKKLDSFKQYYLTDSDEALEISHLTRIFRALSAEQLWTMDERMDGIVFQFEMIPIAIRRLYQEYLIHHPFKQKHVVNSGKSGYTAPAKTRLFRCWMASYAAERPFKTVCAINLIWYSFLGVQMSKKSLASLRPILKDVEKLDLQWHAKKRQLGYFNTIYLDRVYNLLKLAPNLVHLRLMLHARALADVEQDMSFEESQIAPLLGLPEGFVFSRLQVLALNSFVTYEHELLILFESAPSLTYLDLRNIVLLRETADRPRGCFAKIIVAIRTFLRLTRLILGGYLSNGGNQLWYLSEKYSNFKMSKAEREKSLIWRVKHYVTTKEFVPLPGELVRNSVIPPHNDVLPPSPSLPWIKGDYTWSMTLRSTPPPDLTFFEEQEDVDENDVTPPLSPHPVHSLGLPPMPVQTLPTLPPPSAVPKSHMTLSDILGDHAGGGSGAPSVALVKLGADGDKAKTATANLIPKDIWAFTSSNNPKAAGASSSTTGPGKAVSLNTDAKDVLENFDFDTFLNDFNAAGDSDLPTAKAPKADDEKDFLGQVIDKAKTSMKNLQSTGSDRDISGDDDDGGDDDEEEDDEDDDDTEDEEDVNGDKMLIDFDEDEDSHDNNDEDSSHKSHSIIIEDDGVHVPMPKSHSQGSDISPVAGGINGYDNGPMLSSYPATSTDMFSQSLQHYKDYQKEQDEKKQQEYKADRDAELYATIAEFNKSMGDDWYEGTGGADGVKKPPKPPGMKYPGIEVDHSKSFAEFNAEFNALPGPSIAELVAKDIMAKHLAAKAGAGVAGNNKGTGKGKKHISKGDEVVDWKPANGSIHHPHLLPNGKPIHHNKAKLSTAPSPSPSVPAEEPGSITLYVRASAPALTQLEALLSPPAAAQPQASPTEQARTHVQNILTAGASKWTLSRQITAAFASAAPPPNPSPPHLPDGESSHTSRPTLQWEDDPRW